jgi:hypothetical protein
MPDTLSVTAFTPVLSVTLARTANDPLTVAPSVGAVIVTSGAA